MCSPWRRSPGPQVSLNEMRHIGAFPLAFCFSMVSLSWLWVCANSRSWQEHCWGPRPHWHTLTRRDFVDGHRFRFIFLVMISFLVSMVSRTRLPGLTIPLKPETSTPGGSKSCCSFQRLTSQRDLSIASYWPQTKMAPVTQFIIFIDLGDLLFVWFLILLETNALPTQRWKCWWYLIL